MTKEEYLLDLAARRGFIHMMLATGIGALVLSAMYPVLRFLVPPKAGEPQSAGVEVPWKANELKTNSGRIFRFGNQPGILVKTPAGELRAFTAICTHLACTVQYREDMEMTRSNNAIGGIGDGVGAGEHLFEGGTDRSRGR